MDKHKLTELMKELKEYIKNPELCLFDVPSELIETILNPPTDKEGYVHKYYFTDSEKAFIESLSKIIKLQVLNNLL